MSIPCHIMCIVVDLTTKDKDNNLISLKDVELIRKEENYSGKWKYVTAKEIENTVNNTLETNCYKMFFGTWYVVFDWQVLPDFRLMCKYKPRYKENDW